MDIRDLRVDNYVMTFNQYWKVKEIKGNNITLIALNMNKLLDVNIYQIHPIFLTPELAQKLGFKYFKSRSKKNTRTWYRNHFFIYFGKKKGPKMNNKFPLPYVHNLQNLWWERFKTPLELI